MMNYEEKSFYRMQSDNGWKTIRQRNAKNFSKRVRVRRNGLFPLDQPAIQIQLTACSSLRSARSADGFPRAYADLPCNAPSFLRWCRRTLFGALSGMVSDRVEGKKGGLIRSKKAF